MMNNTLLLAQAEVVTGIQWHQLTTEIAALLIVLFVIFLSYRSNDKKDDRYLDTLEKLTTAINNSNKTNESVEKSVDNNTAAVRSLEKTVERNSNIIQNKT